MLGSWGLLLCYQLLVLVNGKFIFIGGDFCADRVGGSYMGDSLPMLEVLALPVEVRKCLLRWIEIRWTQIFNCKDAKSAKSFCSSEVRGKSGL